MLNIQLPNLNRIGNKYYTIGNRKRLAQATSVVFLNENHIAVSSIAALKLYIYHFNFDVQEYHLIDEIDTTYNNKLVYTDLISYDGENTLVLSNFNIGSPSLYKFDENYKLEHYLDIPKLNKNQYNHGVYFDYENKDIIYITQNKLQNFEIITYNYKSNKIINKNKYLRNFNPKSVFSLNNNNLLVIYTTSLIYENKGSQSPLSRLIYYNQNKIIDMIDIKKSHADDITYFNNNIYIGNQYNDTVDKISLINNKLTHIQNIKGYTFPHGIDCNYDLLGVTNYGDNTVKIIKVT